MIEGIQLESWGAAEHMGRCLSYTPARVELAAIFLVILQATKGPAAAVHVLFTPPLLLLYYCFTTALLLLYCWFPWWRRLVCALLPCSYALCSAL